MFLTEHPLARHPVILNDVELLSILTELDRSPDLIYFAAHLTDRVIEHVSLSFYTFLGYTPREFMNAGPDLLYSMCSESVIPEIVRVQQAYIQQAKAKDFDPASVIVFEFQNIPLTGKDRPTILTTSNTVVLSYAGNADLDFAIVTMVESANPRLELYKDRLRKLKLRHNAIYQHPPMRADASPLELVLITTQRFDMDITYREREVLGLLAKGLSGKEVADKLRVSVHTVETHRKNLLRKLAARNTSELIKKASKIFWLE